MPRLQATNGATAADAAAGDVLHRRRDRKQRGDFPTPAELVDQVVDQALGTVRSGQTLRVLDPACGDGRFLVAAGRRIKAFGGEPELWGVDVHPAAVAVARRQLARAGLPGRVLLADALTREWGDERFDVVVGNPPYLSPLATATARRSSRHGGGPYADAAAEFLGLAVRLTAAGGRVGLVLPQSILASRDAGPVRELVARQAQMRWSWWSPRRMFDADVTVCALVFERRPGRAGDVPGRWTRVVTDHLGVPTLPPVDAAGALGDRALITANFRDQYYGLVGAVVEAGAGEGAAGGGDDQPRLVTSGLIDPGDCAWGRRPVRFAGSTFEQPVVLVDELSERLQRWARELLVPKVLVANQTTVIEAVADESGAWLPSVPVLTLRPADPAVVMPMAAVLTSPVASCWAWHRAAGTGLSARSLRLGPRWLGDLPWPAGELSEAVAAYTRGDVVGCGQAVQNAYGIDAEDLFVWWKSSLPDRR